MLYIFDGIAFQVAPVNIDGFERSTGSDLVAQSVLGARPPLEPVGEAGEDLTLRGKAYSNLMPEAVAELEKLRDRSRDGKPGHLQRGDGTNLGWWSPDRFRETGSFIDSQGVARLSEFELSLKRSQAPTGAAFRGA